tara:strand:+ start:4554 stop:5183 length:630 start_codon:yes stop_codon:yes gene_type:complete
VIKLIPLIIFPLSFFLIFLGVKNLTGNFPFDKENIDQNENEEIVKLNKDAEKIEEKITTELEQNNTNNEETSIDADKNLVQIDIKETKIIEVENANESFKKNKPQVKSEKLTNDSKTSQKTTSNIKVVEEINNYLIQFGAFSKKQNAEDLKNSIIQKIHTKFSDFQINLDFDEKKKLYKLISRTNNYNEAKKVCSFSKEIKINCIFKKQ